MRDLKSLVGRNSFIAKEFVVNKHIPSSNTIAKQAGITPLGVHYQLNLALESTYGMKAWRSWVDNIWRAVCSLYTGQSVPAYPEEELDYYLRYCIYMHLALAEVRRDIKMMDWKVATDTDALYDFWGTYRDTIVDSQKFRNVYVDQWNGYARDFYTKYVFKAPGYVDYVYDLLSTVWKDDASGRTNYMYFHLFDNYYNAADPGSLAEPFFRAFARIRSWLYDDGFGFGRIGWDESATPPAQANPNWLPRIIADLTQAFGRAVIHDYVEFTPREDIYCQYNAELIDALNQSPLSIPQVAIQTTASAGESLDSSFGSVYANLVQNFDQFTFKFDQMFDLTQHTMGLGIGPSIFTQYYGSWSSSLSAANKTAWEAVVNKLCDRKFSIPVYHAFDDGAKILSEMAFMVIPEIFTMHGNPQARDANIDFSGSSGAFQMIVHGLFGFAVSRVWYYAGYIYKDNTAARVYTTPLTYWYFGTQTTSSATTMRFRLIPQPAALQSVVTSMCSNMQAAFSVDALTTFQYQMYTDSPSFFVVTDEDVDEWGIVPFQEVINNYGSTADGMFMDAYVVPSRSNKVQDAYNPSGSVGLKVDTRRNGGDYYGTSKKGNKSKVGKASKGQRK